ncbi:MAG: filamentous hemagglutinin N-terminal domain-containing protein, partial [Halobacteria archaeon]|nr:filamentous hemagglutinin N-terminal domain-containing protein [Halobacteria archaeon]
MFTETRQLFHWRRTFHKGREFAHCRRLIAGVLMFGAAAVAVAAPTGGTVVPGSGDATITPGTDTLITQTTDRVDIDWDSFDTVVGESVTFDQQRGDHSVAINRVLDGNRTFFDGMLNANGRVFLINRNGITFGNTAQINVGSLLATTSDTDRVEQDEVLIGQQAQNGVVVYQFSGDGEYATIINEGDITVSDGGFAVLAAPYVENSGFIKADLGQVELASTQDYDLRVDFRGDGLIFFAPQDLPEQFDGGDGGISGPLGVTNTAAGTLQARSGHVYLTANMAAQIVESTVNLSGVVDADQFVSNPNGGVTMVASNGHGHHAYPGGNIVVTSTGDINIGGGADIHAVGGERVRGLFRAADDITMGAEGDAAKITLKATSDSDGYSARDADAEAQLEMVAAGGSLDIAEGVIEVTANAEADNSVVPNGVNSPGASIYLGGRNNARAVATAFMTGEHVDINADITVTADAQASSPDSGNYVNGVASATCYDCGSHGPDAAEAIAALDVIAAGEAGSDYPEGDLTMVGDINVTANAWTEDSRSSMATANTILAATGDLDVEGDIDVDAVAISEGAADEFPSVIPLYQCQTPSCNGIPGNAADANAALLMLSGAPQGLLEPLYYLSFNVPEQLGTLSDILTLERDTGLSDILASLANDLPAGIVDANNTVFGPFGQGKLNYKGDINVTSLAEYNATGIVQLRTQGDAQATSAAYIAGGGDTYIDTDPIKVDSQAYANYDDSVYNPGSVVPSVVLNTGGSYVDSEARSFLVMVAGLGDLPGGIAPTQSNGSNGYYGSDLTILGDVSATATDQETLNGQPQPYPDNPLTGALTALLATGDIKVRGADPLAQAGPLGDADHTALAQGRTSRWQVCDKNGCFPVAEDTGGLGLLAETYPETDIYVAQLIIEAGGDIDIEPKTKTQPNGLFKDPIGPDWPGDKPLRFDASGQMLVATGADATRPPRMAALDSNVEAAILAGGDPSKLLPATASGGCVAA